MTLSTTAACSNTSCGLCSRSQRCSHFLLSRPQLSVGTDFRKLVRSFALYGQTLRLCGETLKHTVSKFIICLLCKRHERLQLLKQSCLTAVWSLESLFHTGYCCHLLFGSTFFHKAHHKIKYDTLLHNTICKNEFCRRTLTLSMYKKLRTQQNIYPVI